MHLPVTPRPRTISLVTFLFGHKKVTPIVDGTNISGRYLVCGGKKSTKRNRVKGRFEQMRPHYNPPPHRQPAFKNVPIFERFHSANLQVCTAEPAENRDIFSGRWSKRREWGSGGESAFVRNASPPDDFFGYFLVRTQESNIVCWINKLQFRFLYFSQKICYSI